MTYVKDTQDFFGARAANWETRFPDDDPLFESAIGELGLRLGIRALDAGCGTGRALPFLQRAVGDSGEVIGADLTSEMIAQATRLGRSDLAALLVADVMRLPFASESFDTVFAAGLIPHLVDPRGGLAELARVTVPEGSLAIFHPIGRATLAARHGGTPSDDDVLAERPLRALLAATGWEVVTIDDGVDRYLATAVRSST